MDSLTIYFILFTSFCFEGAWSKTHDHELLKEVDFDKRIEGGVQEAQIEDHPYVAYLMPQGNTGFLEDCSGAIVSRRHIVTSARCLENADSVDIRVGSTDRHSGGEQHSTTVFMTHPMYLEGERDYDVGVLVVPEGMKIDGNTVDTIDVVELGDDPTSGDSITVSGWGRVEHAWSDKISLKKAKLNVISRGQCEGEASGITNRLFCAKDDEGTHSACMGDFGDPAVNQNGQLAGVVSRTTKCDPAHPQTITRFGEPTIRAFILAMTTE